MSGDYDIRHRRKNENMQHGDDAHKANNGDIKADAKGNQSTRMEGIVSRTALTNLGWVRFRLDQSPRQHCNYSIASHR
jgi:hypothetical protein